MRRLSSQATSAASRASPRGAAGRASLPRAAAASTRGPSSSGFSRTTTAQYYGGGEGAPSRRPSWNTASSTATTTVPPPTMRQRSVASPAARQPQPRPVPMQMQQEPAPRAFLARSDVVDKQVRHFCFDFSIEFSHASKEGRCCRSRVRLSPSSSLSLKTRSTSPPRLLFPGHRQDLGPLPRRRRPHVRRRGDLPGRQRRAACQGARRGGRARRGRGGRLERPVGAGAGLDLGREAAAAAAGTLALLFFFVHADSAAAPAADGHEPAAGDPLPGRRRRPRTRRARAVVPAARQPEGFLVLDLFLFPSGPRGAILDDAAAATGAPHGSRGGPCRRGARAGESARVRLRPGDRGAACAAVRRARRAAHPGR